MRGRCQSGQIWLSPGPILQLPRLLHHRWHAQHDSHSASGARRPSQHRLLYRRPNLSSTLMHMQCTAACQPLATGRTAGALRPASRLLYTLQLGPWWLEAPPSACQAAWLDSKSSSLLQAVMTHFTRPGTRRPPVTHWPRCCQQQGFERPAVAALSCRRAWGARQECVQKLLCLSGQTSTGMKAAVTAHCT